MKLVTTFLFLFFAIASVRSEDEYKFFTWSVTYGDISPLGVQQQGILINGQFPGPQLDLITNDNIIINVINNLDEPFLITWNGIKQRKNSWQDGVLGTNCPIPPNSNYTYKFQAKDQIGTYTYFPSTAIHRASGGFGALNIHKRSVIAIPYNEPDGEFTLLAGDWYQNGHKVLRQALDSGMALGLPDGLLINGMPQGSTFTGEQGKTYLIRISNVGLSQSINFRIQNHNLKVVEVEGSHVLQNTYDSLDIHVGQSYAALLTLDQAPKDYYIAVSSRFTQNMLTATAVLHYSNSDSPISQDSIPTPPAGQLDWSMQQATTFRWNLTANAARPNPQGSYHYGNITRTSSLVLASSAPVMNGKQRYAVNGVSYVVPDTPLKLADYFNIDGVFTWDSIPSSLGASVIGTPALRYGLHDFIEIVFQNTEDVMQSWHLDGYDFWVVGYGSGTWTASERSNYNLVDALTRHTVQVFPTGWSAILVSLDNQGMWNVRSAMWGRQYLGQQFYMRVWTSQQSFANEYTVPTDVLLCGKATGLHT